MIYLDYAASAPPYAQAADEQHRVMCSLFANPGGLHQPSCDARRLLSRSRRSLARLMGVGDREIFFTSGGTEANNWAVKTALAATKKRHFVLSATEHKSVLESARRLSRESGYSLSLVQPDGDGLIRPEAVKAAIRPETGLICVHAVNNETGVIQDVEAMAALAHSHRALYLCDAVQSFGHLRQKLSVADFVSVSAHKLGGPRGVGFLAMRLTQLSRAFMDGGGQELGLRSGTENLPAIAGFATAAELAFDGLDAEYERLTALSADFLALLRTLVPAARLNSGTAPRQPGIMNLHIPGISAEELALRLDMSGICVSPGAACSAREGAPSHVLTAMGLSIEEASSSVRISTGRLTTAQELEHCARSIAKILEYKRKG